MAVAAYRQAQANRLMGALLREPFLVIVDSIYKAVLENGFTDITHAHLTPFRHIDEEHGSRLIDLANDAQMTKQSMGSLIDHLEQNGYVVRIPDPEDGRARLIVLTDKGRQIMKIAREAVANTEEEWAAYLGAEQMDQLRTTLRELAAYLAAKKRLSGNSANRSQP